MIKLRRKGTATCSSSGKASMKGNKGCNWDWPKDVAMIERHIVRLHLKIDKTSPAKYINKFDKKEKALIDSPGLANISTRSTVGLLHAP